uniref:Ig-like domain-containing protein n=1 Tax=Cyclopterus lumpus TaxID=8103 RepID=A0A8C2WZW7_CYCLU
MKIIFYLLLILRVGRCTDDQILETKTVGVGQNVTLTCARDTSLIRETWFWIRIVSGNLPEFLGGTYNFIYDDSDKTLRITTKQEPGTFLLHIHEAKLSDVGLYSCMKVNQLNLTFLKGTFLSIGEPDITFITQDFPSAPVRPGDSVTLQCSVLSHSERRTCPGEPSVFWFRVGSDESHPSLIYAQRSNSAGCEKSPEAHSPQKCVYSFSKDVTSSDVGTHYCAVATCGQILFGNGTKLDIKVDTSTFYNAAPCSLVIPRQLGCMVGINCSSYYSPNLITMYYYYRYYSYSYNLQDADRDAVNYAALNFSKRKVPRVKKRESPAECVYSAVRADYQTQRHL